MQNTKGLTRFNSSWYLKKFSNKSLKSDTEIKSFLKNLFLNKHSETIYNNDPLLIKHFKKFISDFINSGDKFFLSEKAYYEIINLKDKIPVFSKDIIENSFYSIRPLIPSEILVYYLFISENFSEKIMTDFIFSLRNRIVISKGEENEFLEKYSIIKLNYLFQEDFKIDNIFLKQLTGINIHSQSIKFI